MMQDEILLLNTNLNQKSQAHKKSKPLWQARLHLQLRESPMYRRIFNHMLILE